jgi:transcriptional regulator with XRE-family HTH domain
MTDLERIIKVVDWLIFEKKIESQRDLAEKLSYTESSLSQIINGKVPLSSKFIKKLSILDERINIDWIIDGVGEMLLRDTNEILKEPEVEYKKPDIPYELYKLTLENEKLSKQKELELIKQNGELIEMLKKAYGK